MDFIHIVNSLPLWLSGLLFVSFGALLVPAGQIAVRRRYGVDSLLNNNEVAGFKYAVLGVVYAVLLVFITVVVWDEYREAESNVEQEARAIRDLNRLSTALPGSDRLALQETLLDYSRVVVEDEWGAMAERSASPAAEAALSRIFETGLGVMQSGPVPQSIRDSALDLMIEVADSRQRRLDGAAGAIPTVLWIVILVGGAVTMSFTWFFGARNAIAQAAMTAMLALTIVLVIYVSVLLDRPFTGHVSVTPEAFVQTIEALEQPTFVSNS